MTAGNIKMTQSVNATAPVSAAPGPRNLQRESLEQVVRLSIQCTAEERRIEQEHADALDDENAQYRKKSTAAQQRHQKRVADLAADTAQRLESIQQRYDTQRQAVEAANQSAQRTIMRRKDEAEAEAKKQVEEPSWQAESVLVAIEMRVDTDEQKTRKEEVNRLAELASLEVGAQEAMARYKMDTYPVETKLDDTLKDEPAPDRQAAVEKYLQQAANLLNELRALTQARMGDGLKFWKRGKVEAQINEIYVPLMQAIAGGRHAVKSDAHAAAQTRQRRTREARRKCEQDIREAREKGDALLRQANQEYRVAVAEQTNSYNAKLVVTEEEKQRSTAELERENRDAAECIEREESAARAEIETQHAAALASIEAAYETQCHALALRWDDGLRAVTALLAAGSGIDPQLVDWNSPAWDQWKSPGALSGQIRFGEMKVDLAELTEQVPKRLQLPGTFSVPAMLTLPARASLLVETDHAGRGAGIDVAVMVMARVLTQMPAGRAKFTIFDPVGLGQSFAGFMHLADHDESLVGSRIWTEKEHMEQRLANLTEHMETVIQKYLRNEYETIDQYNAQAGELAEPFRFLVIADFPTGFEAEALRRLASIAISGPRCGVYTIILRDTRQAIPPGARMEEIISRSAHLLWTNGKFVWDDAVFKRFPLRVDPPPTEKRLTHLMDLVGHAAKEAKRVEVPFGSIAPPAGQFWSASSRSDLRVPIGKSGATRLQALRLGVGVAQHVLVAGRTGSGKSNLMHTIVTNMAMWYGPDEVEFYLIDFKKGVEFKAYAASQLPHARAIAVESDREFGLSVLQRVDAELTRRGVMFRDAGAQDIAAFRDATGAKLPRTVLLIDEFQEFFSEDDKVGQEASGLLDRLVRQGRAFGVHVVLGSQTIGGSSGLARSTLGQIAVRVALQCTEADSQMILGDNNSAARLLTRPGEAIYNDAGGLVEANSPFQIAFLPDEQRTRYLEQLRALCQTKAIAAAAPIVFEGNAPALIRKNHRLMALLQRPDFPPPASSVLAYVGEPVAIKEPSAIPFRRQSGGNVLMVGQQEESAVAIFASMVASLAAQHKPGEASFYLMDGTPADSRCFGMLERVLAAIPHKTKVVGWREVAEAINELATTLAQRQGTEAHGEPAAYLLLFGLQRYRLLRHTEDDFSFSKSADAAPPKPDKQLAELLSEGPAVGLHTIIWADAPITLERTLDRASMRQFDHRILFQMSASDSSNLIDSPLANRLGTHRALLYSEEQGTIEKCRPYEMPDDAWLEFLAGRLKSRSPA
jgi:hypothetical protein